MTNENNVITHLVLGALIFMVGILIGYGQGLNKKTNKDDERRFGEETDKG
jgi:hypothetical protein